MRDGLLGGAKSYGMRGVGGVVLDSAFLNAGVMKKGEKGAGVMQKGGRAAV